MKTINRRIVAAHIVSSDGKILFGRKTPGSVYEDCWHIPGGGVDEGETDEQAILREIKEETGLDTSNAAVVLIDDQAAGQSQKTLADGETVMVNMQFNIFKITLDKPADEIKVIESDDLIDLQWFTLEELGSIKLTPPEVKLLERLGTDWLVK